MKSFECFLSCGLSINLIRSKPHLYCIIFSYIYSRCNLYASISSCLAFQVRSGASQSFISFIGKLIMETLVDHMKTLWDRLIFWRIDHESYWACTYANCLLLKHWWKYWGNQFLQQATLKRIISHLWQSGTSTRGGLLRTWLAVRCAFSTDEFFSVFQIC